MISGLFSLTKGVVNRQRDDHSYTKSAQAHSSPSPILPSYFQDASFEGNSISLMHLLPVVWGNSRADSYKTSSEILIGSARSQNNIFPHFIDSVSIFSFITPARLLHSDKGKKFAGDVKRDVFSSFSSSERKQNSIFFPNFSKAQILTLRTLKRALSHDCIST